MLRAVIGTLDPTLTDVSIAKDLKNSFIIRRRGREIIIQEGKLLNREMLSSGTAEGIDVSLFLASMLSHKSCFYYCDEHFSYIHSDIEKIIFGLMIEILGRNEQLILTTHNTSLLSNEFSRPDCNFIMSRQRDKKGESIKIANLSNLTEREIKKVHNLEKMYRAGAFA